MPRCSIRFVEHVIEAVERRLLLAGDLPALHVSAGGLQVADSIARAFVPDSGFSGGHQVQSPTYDVTNVTGNDDTLFSTYRAGQSFTYTKSIPNDHYALWLEFAEPTFTTVGQRTFNVTAEGAKILDHFDIISAAGANHTAVAKSFDMKITDGQLNLTFTGNNGSEAIVSAIVVVPTDPSPAAAPYSWLGLSETGRIVFAQNNLRSIGLQLMSYATGQKGNYPPDLAAAQHPYDVPISSFADPRTETLLPRGELTELENVSWVRSRNDFIYLGAGKKTSLPPDGVLAYENPDRVNGDIGVLWGDLHVSVLARADAAQLIGFQNSPPSDPPPPIPQLPPANPKVFASLTHLNNLYKALDDYSLDHQNARLPASLGELFLDGYLTDITQFVNPRSATPLPPANWTVQQKAAWIDANHDYTLTVPGQIFLGRGNRLLITENRSQFSDGIDQAFYSSAPEFHETRWADETLKRYVKPAPPPTGASISGIVFNDTNANGVKDSNESGIAGATLYNDANNNLAFDAGEAILLADNKGVYTFSGLPAGAYKIRQVLQPGWTQTTPAKNYGWTISLATNQQLTGTDFGTRQSVIATGASISGIVFHDLNGNGVRDAGENGVAGITLYNDANNNYMMESSEIRTTTDSNGAYTFTGLSSGNYKIRQILQTGWSQTTPAKGYGWTISLGTNQTLTGRDFGTKQTDIAPPPTTGASIAGVVYNDANANDKQDAGELGVAGVMLYNDANNNVKLDPGELTTVTDVNGAYRFSGLSSGNYKIRQILQTGWVQTTPANNYGWTISLATNQNLTARNFGTRQSTTSTGGKISGTIFNDLDGDGVKDSSEVGVGSGWMIYIDLDNDSIVDSNEMFTSTDASGDWTLSGLSAGTYKVRQVLQAGWVQTIPTKNYGLNVTLSTNQSVSGRLFGSRKIA